MLLRPTRTRPAPTSVSPIPAPSTAPVQVAPFSQNVTQTNNIAPKAVQDARSSVDQLRTQLQDLRGQHPDRAAVIDAALADLDQITPRLAEPVKTRGPFDTSWGICWIGAEACQVWCRPPNSSAPPSPRCSPLPDYADTTQPGLRPHPPPPAACALAISSRSPPSSVACRTRER